MRRLASVALAAFLGLGLVLGLTAPAHAAVSRPPDVVQTILPGSTPYVPASVRTDSVEAGSTGAVSDYLSGLLYAGKGAVQSIQQAGWDLIHAAVGKPRTNTGQGYITATGAPNCRASFTGTGGSWASGAGQVDRLPITRTTTTNSTETVAACDANGTLNGNLTCLTPDGRLVTNVVGTSMSVAFRNGCKSDGLGVALVAWVEPTASDQRYIGTDGGRWTNPDTPELVAARSVVQVEKTCRPIPPASGADVIVNGAGAAGSGTAPNVACPTGTYPAKQRVWSSLVDGSFARDLTSSSLKADTAAKYPGCLAGDCALAVAIDGVKCALTGIGCAEWWANKAGSLAGKVACKWGNYDMPVDDCAPLANCYKVPLDSIQTGAAASSGCGINPAGGPGSLPEPIQDGKVGFPPTPSVSPAPSSTSGTSGSDGASGAPGGAPTVIVNVPTPQVSVTVNVPQPTVIVNVPQPTVIVNVPDRSRDPVVVQGGGEGSSCFAGDDGGASGKAGIEALAQSKGLQATAHLDPSGKPSFDLFASGAANTALAEELRVNHARYGLTYVISQMRIASEKSGWAWRDYTPIQSTGDFRHDIHVHVTYGNSTASSEVQWNPVDWAYKPMKCALSSALDGALSPTPGKVGDAGDAIGDALGKPLKGWTDAVGSYSSAFSVTAPADCKGPAMVLPEPFNRTLYPASSCSEPAATLALVSKVGTGAVLIVSGLLACVRLLAAGLGYQGVPGGGE